MSRETSQWLNTMTLIGMTEQRGNAWHYRADDQGGEPNHYFGPIPVGDVERRLFNWEAVKVPVFVGLPASIETATTIDAAGNPVAVQQDETKMAIVNAATGKVFKYAGEGYAIHQYREWLLGTVSNLLGDTLVITSAGLLKDGAQAWVEVSVPETLHDSVTGVDYRTNLLAFTSHDSSLATTYGRTITMTVCDNTREAAAGEMGDQKAKVKHSKRSTLKLDETRNRLAILEQQSDDFLTEIHELAAWEVTDKQWFAFLDEFRPIPEADGRSKSIILRERDELVDMYRRDERAAQWRGTAFGVVQAVNTWAHHVATVKNVSRADRNAEGAITGRFAKLDTEVLNTLGKVLANN